MARYLVHNNLWGVMGTNSRDRKGLPWTNVVDLSDGPVCNSTGRLFFYLTSLDETAYDVEVYPTVSFTVAEAAITNNADALGCGSTDVEDPTCAKLVVIGDLLVVPKDEQDYAIDLLASRHPVIKSWPANHGFQPYELHIDTLNILDFYGGMKQVPTQEYFNANYTSC
eukprot:CAMPEP_0197476984 /NCGR_PEP_ID=MMETSP1309-20131121/12484_1 /TAXON_ID=464262 /ORGANISM="Genus nov. species nov., Strain RCC998" /LENGTH=167 /DNA_ID=CAMNT_0043017649 /DNA_START=216 /DNA_END=719 /DNA_ORIENTATION=+